MIELENFFSKTTKKAVSFRLSEISIERLKDMSETLNSSQAEIIELLITALHYSEKNEDNAPYENSKWFEKVLEMCAERFNETKKERLDHWEIGLTAEVYHMMMNAAAKAMGSILGQDVIIDKPIVELVKCWGLDAFLTNIPACGIEVKYVSGLTDTILFVLKQRDIIQIIDVWRGGMGDFDRNVEFNATHTNGICEIMETMMRQASLALADVNCLNMQVNAASPTAFEINNNDDYNIKKADSNDIVVATQFRLVVGDIIDSQMAAVISIPFAREIANAYSKVIRNAQISNE